MTRTFRGFKSFTQAIILTSAAVGLILSIFFSYSDLTNHSWWADKSYIPNVLAALTGFLIGAPIALVILATFAGEREEKSTLDRVNRLTQVAWWAFRDLVNEFCSEERYEIVVGQARDIKARYDDTSAAISAIIDNATYAELSEENKDNEINQEIVKLREIEPKFREAVNSFTQTFKFQTEDEWAQITGSWRVLDQYVRLQRLEQNLEWFNSTADSGFRKWMSRESNPVQELANLVEIRRYTPNISLNVDTMRNSLDTLAAYLRMNEHDLVGYLYNSGNIFDAARSAQYHIDRDAAQLFLLDLKRYIGLIEGSYWPHAHKAPMHDRSDPDLTPHEWLGSLQTAEGKKEFEATFYRVAAEVYHKRLRRRPEGNLSGPEMRAIDKERQRQKKDAQ